MNRPWTVTMLTFGVLTFTGLCFTRFVQAIIQWEFLSTLPLTVTPMYLVWSGLICGLAGLLLAWGMWRGRTWVVRITRAFAVIYAIYFWADRFFLMNRVSSLVSWPFMLAATLVFLFLLFWILARPATKTFFGERND